MGCFDSILQFALEEGCLLFSGVGPHLGVILSEEYPGWSLFGLFVWVHLEGGEVEVVVFLVVDWVFGG